MLLTSAEMARRAAQSALWQRRRGDARPLRELFASAYSLLRYLHARTSACA